MTRFAGYPYPDGLLVLDTETGAVVRVPHAGPPARLFDGVAVGSVDESERTPLDDEVRGAFPSPIALAWDAYLRETDVRHRVRLVVDAFATTIKLWALVPLAAYAADAELRDPQINALLERNLSRPLISDWPRALQVVLPRLEARPGQRFVAKLAEAYRHLEARPQRVAVSEHVESEDGTTSSTVSQRSPIDALVWARNQIAHVPYLGEESATELLALTDASMRTLLEASRFFVEMPLFEILERSGDRVTIRRTMGRYGRKAAVETRVQRLPPSTDFVFLAEDDALPLGPFAIRSPSDSDVLLFEGNTRSYVRYVSVSGSFVRLQRQLPELRRLLDAKSGGPRSDPDRWTWEELVRRAGEHTRGVRETLIDVEDESLFVARRDVEAHLEAFRSDEEARALSITAESGLGKSVLLAQWSRRFEAAGDLALLFRASTLDRDGLGAAVARALGARLGTHIEQIAERLAEVRSGQSVWWLVDGLDESRDPVALLRELEQLAAQLTSTPWIRIATTSTPSLHDRLAVRERLGATPTSRFYRVRSTSGEPTASVPLLPLDDEALAEAYERFRSHTRPGPDGAEHHPLHRPTTAFSELSPTGSTVAMLRHPLMLRLVLESHHRRPLPSELPADEVMNSYLERVVAGDGVLVRRSPERMRFLRAFVRELDRRHVSELDRDVLYEVEELSAALDPRGSESVYQELLRLGVLRETWEESRCRVSVALRPLTARLLADELDERITSAERVLALARRAKDLPMLRDALVVLLHRAVRRGDLSILVDALDLSSPLEAERGVIVAAARELFHSLAASDDATLARLLEAMVQHPSEADVELLLAAFDDAFAQASSAFSAACTRIARAASAEAVALGRPLLRARAQLRLATLAQRRGELEHAERFAREAADESHDDPELRGRAGVLLGRVLLEREDTERAAEVVRGVIDALRGAEAPPVLCDALRLLATLDERRGAHDDAEVLLREALSVARASQDRDAEARVLQQTAHLLHQRGALDEAAAQHRESVALKRRRPDRVSLAISLLNLGALAIERGDAEEARHVLDEARTLFESAGHDAGVAAAETNLGNVDRAAGRLEDAHVRWMRTLAIHERRGHLDNQAYLLWLLANLAHDRDEVSTARELRMRFERIVGDSPSPKRATQRVALAVREQVANANADVLSALADQLERALADQARIGRVDADEAPLDALELLASKLDPERALTLRTEAARLAGRSLRFRR